MVRRHCLMALVSGAAVVVAGLVVTAPAQAGTATAPAASTAPGAPGAPSYFDLARKDCVGTAAGQGPRSGTPWPVGCSPTCTNPPSTTPT